MLFYLLEKIISYEKVYIYFSTNIQAIGIDETAARLSAMIEKGKQMINIPQSVPLDCVVSIN